MASYAARSWMLNNSLPLKRFLFSYVTETAAPRSPAVLVPSGWNEMEEGLLVLILMSQSSKVVSGTSVKRMLV